MPVVRRTLDLRAPTPLQKITERAGLHRTERGGRGGGRGALLFLVLSHLTVDHTSLSRGSTVPTLSAGGGRGGQGKGVKRDFYCLFANAVGADARLPATMTHVGPLPRGHGVYWVQWFRMRCPDCCPVLAYPGLLLHVLAWRLTEWDRGIWSRRKRRACQWRGRRKWLTRRSRRCANVYFFML